MVHTFQRYMVVPVVLAATLALADAPSTDLGSALYARKCASCHGVDGKGNTEEAKKMKMPDLVDKKYVEMSDEEMFQRIVPGNKNLSAEQIHSLVTYIRELQKQPK